MNAFDLLFWVLLAYLAVRMLARDEPRLWLAFGAIAGLGLENKVSVTFLAFGLVVGLLATPQRRLLASRWLWLGGALALLLFLPHLFWQLREGWPTLEFMANAQAEKTLPLTPLEFLLQQIVLVHPLNLPLWLGGLAALLVTPGLARFRALGWAYLAVFALLAIQQTKAYYLAPIYPLLFAAGSVRLEAFCTRRRLGLGDPRHSRAPRRRRRRDAAARPAGAPGRDLRRRLGLPPLRSAALRAPRAGNAPAALRGHARLGGAGRDGRARPARAAARGARRGARAHPQLRRGRGDRFSRTLTRPAPGDQRPQLVLPLGPWRLPRATS